jgi:hypothetical protein
MMKPVDFERTMLRLLGRKPFQPFVIEFDDGDRFVISQPEAIHYLGGPSAAFFSPDKSVNLFDSRAVRQFLELTAAAST